MFGQEKLVLFSAIATLLLAALTVVVRVTMGGPHVFLGISTACMFVVTILAKMSDEQRRW